MTINWKSKSFQSGAYAAFLALTAGCSGINASKSVSPLDFLIPGGGGLMRGFLYVPPASLPPSLQGSPATPVIPVAEATKQVALLR